MPKCNHSEFKKLLRKRKQWNSPFLDDNEKIFFCHRTKRVFRRYEDFALQTVANSCTIWRCQITGRENLIYDEALNSEKHALDKLSLNENLRPVVLIFIKTVKQTSLQNLCSLTYEFIEHRFFVNEIVKLKKSSKRRQTFRITNVKPKSSQLHSIDNIAFKPDQVEYTIKSNNDETKLNGIIVQFDQIKRFVNTVKIQLLKKFIEKNVVSINGILYPKHETFQKYVESKNLSLNDFFVGQIPRFFCFRRDKFIQENALMLSKTTDDLERFDQKLLPKYEKVSTYLSDEYFGDVIMLSEFLHSFSKILSFKRIISLPELIRAFTTLEINGPLYEILINLLKTIFNLQKNEESKYPIRYTTFEENKHDLKLNKAMNDAHKMHLHLSGSFHMKPFQLPLNLSTLSEVLRLHFLSSGANVTDPSSKEDPGLMFCIEQPRIIESLKTLNIYELPIRDVFEIVNTLIAQILTYSSVIKIVNSKMSKLSELKLELKRNFYLQMQHDQAVQTRNDFREINKTRKLTNDIFELKPFLGIDRCYRKYYVLKSIPGVFVEHPFDCPDECLKNPPTNVRSFIDHPQSKFLIEKFLNNLYNKLRTEQKSSKTINNNDLEYNDLNNPLGIDEDLNRIESRHPISSQYELMMCTGCPTNCIVHGVKNPDQQRWAYIYKEEDIDALIESLNPNGERESKLKTNLSTMRDLIVNHTRNCPVEVLSIKSSINEKLNLSKKNHLNQELYKELIKQILKLERNIVECKLRRKDSCLKLEMPNITEDQVLEVSMCVKEIAMSVLKLKQSINAKFFKYENLTVWENSLLASTSFSQVFLHMHVLDRSIRWKP